jgi:hypothetical protein
MHPRLKLDFRIILVSKDLIVTFITTGSPCNVVEDYEQIGGLFEKKTQTRVGKFQIFKILSSSFKNMKKHIEVDVYHKSAKSQYETLGYTKKEKR